MSAPDTAALLLPLRPPVAVAHYTVKRPWWVRHAPRKGDGYVAASVVLALCCPAYAIAGLLTGGAS